MVIVTPSVQCIRQRTHAHLDEEKTQYLGSAVKIQEQALDNLLETKCEESRNQNSNLRKASKTKTSLRLICSSEEQRKARRNAIKYYLPRKGRFFILALTIIMISHATVYGAHPRACQVSIKTLKVVSECPKNEDVWVKRAHLKACNLIKQNCTSTDHFQYHCVLDEKGTHLVEVCAPVHFIIGRLCAEFNSEGMVIQSRRTAPCNDFDIPCTFKYSSNELYKYPNCCKYVKGAALQDTATDSALFKVSATLDYTPNIAETNTTVTTDDTSKSSTMIIITVVCSSLGVAMLLCATFVIVYMNRKQKFSTTGKRSSDGLLPNVKLKQNQKETEEHLISSTYPSNASCTMEEEKHGSDESVDSGFQGEQYCTNCSDVH